jgi:hypothetical protein
MTLPKFKDQPELIMINDRDGVLTEKGIRDDEID